MNGHDKIQENFDKFHATYPGVYRLFDRFTWEMIRAGQGHGSAGLIFERIRWEHIITIGDAEKHPRLNNNYRSRYARMWEANNPEMAGFFRNRRLRAVSADSTSRAQEPYVDA